MSPLPKSLIALSFLFLSHSCYSAHEHSSTSSSGLPLDIIIETLLGASLLCLGIVLSSSTSLRPISLRVWAGQLEREKGYGPYGFLDERLGFWDVRAKREEFTKLVKAQEKES